MRYLKIITRLATVTFITAISVPIVGCSGDARPLEEAVEASQQNLASLEIVPPPRSLEPLYISTGAQVVFRLQGTNTTGNLVSVSAENRRWALTLTEGAEAIISDDGVLVAEAEGLVTVSARVGGVGATYDLEISDQPLTAIADIKGPDNFQELRGCEPVKFSAEGLFGDEKRTLRDTVWTVEPEEVARNGATIDGVVDVIGLNPGSATLTATVDEVSGFRTLMVGSELQSITIAPSSIGVKVGETITLSATGNYNPSMPETAVITESVDWRIVIGESFAGLSNSESSKGQLTGIAPGTVTLEAGCGLTLQTATAIVSESAVNLSFDQDGPIRISVDSQEQQLNVSTGSTYSEDSDVTDSAEWSVTDGSQYVSVNNVGTDKGLLTPIAVGDATVRATFNDESISINVEVF